MKYYAHSHGNDPGDWQELADHLLAVAKLAKAHAAKFGAGAWGEAAGLLHDLGKYAPEAQARIAGLCGPVDHSTAGAQIARTKYGVAGHLVAAAVAGHHVGLANGLENGERTPLTDRLAASVPDASAWSNEITLPVLAAPSLGHHTTAWQERAGLTMATLGRMVFSALVDADYLDTEAFYARAEGWSVDRGNWHELAVLQDRLALHMADKTRRAKATKINTVRAEVLTAARQAAKRSTGVFTLTVPTGAGKTLASLTFALNHAVAHKLDRVIYVAPYTAIIEQTANVFRAAIGSDQIVEHHSASRDTASREGRNKLQLATENWDAPIIVTTAVQFFESLFSDRPGRCRKLHNIARSVVVLDEAQTLPLNLLRPCVAILDELARNYRASVVLCTATQPALIERPAEPARSFSGGIEDRTDREIAPDPERLYQELRRVTVRTVGTMTDTDLVTAMRAGHQTLTIVNTRRHARDLYATLGGLDGAAHLSALMCPAHRSIVLDDIKRRLLDDLPVRLVATAVIEAGVDIDFRTVFRAVAGLDQIAQAAGRCNREMRYPASESVVTIFEPTEREPQYMRAAADATRAVMRAHPDALSLDAVEAYFRRLYWGRQLGRDGLDEPSILARLNARASDLLLPHESVARDMRLIDDAAVTIIVPRDQTARRLISDLEASDRVGSIARNLQRYGVGLYARDFERLRQLGSVTPIAPDKWGDQFWVLRDEGRYDDDVGLDIWA
jgi:CRISPR-associated endonuclease/helicase Cas3